MGLTIRAVNHAFFFLAGKRQHMLVLRQDRFHNVVTSNVQFLHFFAMHVRAASRTMQFQ